MQLIPIAPLPVIDRPLGAAALDVVTAARALYDRRGHVPPWICYLALCDDTVVGSCGFAGPPAAGEVEIAYYTFPGYEGHGLATRMAATLLELTRPEAERLGLRFIAHTLPAEGASTTILRKLGFRLRGPIAHPEDGEVWCWCQAPPVGA